MSRIIVSVILVSLFWWLEEQGKLGKIKDQIRKTQSEVFTPTETGMQMLTQAQAEMHERVMQKKKNMERAPSTPGDPGSMMPREAMDKCGTEGCYNGQPTPKKQGFNDPHYIPSTAKIPSAQDISRMQTAADDCDTPGCDVDKSIGTAPARKTRRYPLGYQLTLAEAILHRGGKRRIKTDNKGGRV